MSQAEVVQLLEDRSWVSVPPFPMDSLEVSEPLGWDELWLEPALLPHTLPLAALAVPGLQEVEE